MPLADSLKSRSAAWALTVQLELPGASTLTIRAGTANVQDFWNAGMATLSGFFPSLLSVGELLDDLAGGARPTFRFKLRNGVVETSDGPMEICDALRGRGVIGGRVTYSCFFQAAVPGTLIEQIVLFVGTIYSFGIEQDGVNFRAADDDPERVQIPVRTIAPDAMLYGQIPGSPAPPTVREGKMPDDSAGSVVPIAYGRFDLTAIERTWDATDPNNPTTWSRMLHIFPAMFGVKFPMIPLVLLSNLFQYRISGVSSSPTDARYHLYAFGDTDEGANALEIAKGGGWQLAPSFGASEDMQFNYTGLFTWDQETDQASQFLKDQGDNTDEINKVVEKPYTSVWYPGKPSSHTSSTNTSPNRFVETWAVEQLNPNWQANEIEWWSGRTMGHALVPEKISEFHGTTDTIAFGTTSGTSNAQNAFDRDLVSFASLSGSNRLSLQMQAQGPRLGDVIAVRIVVVVGTTLDMACRDVRCAFRFHPAAGGVLANPTVEFQAIQVGATAVVQHIPSLLLENWFSFYIWRLPLLSTDMQFGHGPPQWEFVEMAGTPQQQWVGDLVIWPQDTLELKVFQVWMEPVFRNNATGLGVKKEGSAVYIRAIVEPPRRQPWNSVVPTSGQFVRMVGTSELWLVPYSGNLANTELQPLGASRVYLAGRAQTFRASGSRWKPGYTPNTGDPIEHPLSIALHSIDKYLGHYNDCEIASGQFGSFRDAIAYLEVSAGANPAYRVSAYQPDRISFRDWLSLLGDHCRSQIVRHRDVTGAQRWRVIVQCPDPATAFPGNRWRAGAETIHPNDTFTDNLIVDFTSKEELRSRFVMRFGFHAPTGRYSLERMCNKDSTNLATEGTLYKSALATTETRYRDPVTLVPFVREEILEFPWLWFAEVADDLLKFHINAKRDRRVVVSFSGGANLLDLQTGHIVYLDDDFASFIGTWPGISGASNWEAHQLVVATRNVAITRRGIEVELSLVEPYALPT